MTGERRIACGSRCYTVRVYDNDTVGLFDEEDRLIVGCLATALPASDAFEELSDEWCAVLAGRLRLAS